MSAIPQPTEEDLHSLGYAKGLYSCTCNDCKDQFIGAKLAYRCISCARTKFLDLHRKGIKIELSAIQVANAIMAYLVAHGYYIEGPRTVTCAVPQIQSDQSPCLPTTVYVDPSGHVVHDGKIIKNEGFFPIVIHP